MELPPVGLVIMAYIFKQCIERAAGTKPAQLTILLRDKLLQTKGVIRLATRLTSHKRSDFFLLGRHGNEAADLAFIFSLSFDGLGVELDLFFAFTDEDIAALVNVIWARKVDGLRLQVVLALVKRRLREKYFRLVKNEAGILNR